MKNSVFPIDPIAVTTEKDELNQIVEKTRILKQKMKYIRHATDYKAT